MVHDGDTINLTEPSKIRYFNKFKNIFLELVLDIKNKLFSKISSLTNNVSENRKY